MRIEETGKELMQQVADFKQEELNFSAVPEGRTKI